MTFAKNKDDAVKVEAQRILRNRDPKSYVLYCQIICYFFILNIFSAMLNTYTGATVEQGIIPGLVATLLLAAILFIGHSTLRKECKKAEYDWAEEYKE